MNMQARLAVGQLPAVQVLIEKNDLKETTI
jgi:hypothetical protein